MKILLYTEACFTDSSFPLYKAMKEKGLDVSCLVNLSSLHTSVIDIDRRISKQSIIPASAYKELQFFEGYMDLNRVFIVNHKLSNKYPWRFLLSTIDIIRFIRKGRFDIIQTDHLLRGARKLLYCFSKKMVYVCHDPIEHTGMEFSKALKRDFALVFSRINKIVILNTFQYKDFCAINHLNPESVLVNRMGPLDCVKLYIKEPIKVIENNIIFFGRIVQYKGVEYLCEAMVKVHEEMPSATLTIAGSGKFYFDMSPYEKLPYINVINRFIPNDELAKLISQAEISIYPYTDSTQSGSLLTSYALNKPVIATDIPAMRETVVDEKSGVLVPPRSSESLAKAILEMLQNKQRIKAMKEYIDQEFTIGERSWSHIVEKYELFYAK